MPSRALNSEFVKPDRFARLGTHPVLSVVTGPKFTWPRSAKERWRPSENPLTVLTLRRSSNETLRLTPEVTFSAVAVRSPASASPPLCVDDWGSVTARALVENSRWNPEFSIVSSLLPLSTYTLERFLREKFTGPSSIMNSGDPLYILRLPDSDEAERFLSEVERSLPGMETCPPGLNRLRFICRSIKALRPES